MTMNSKSIELLLSTINWYWVILVLLNLILNNCNILNEFVESKNKEIFKLVLYIDY